MTEPPRTAGLKRVALVTLVMLVVNTMAFKPQPDTSLALWWWLLGAYGLLSALAIHHFWNEGTLLDRLAPRWGDLSIGAMLGIVLLVGSWIARGALAPSDTPRYAWLYLLYLQLGDPEVLQNSAALTIALLLVCIGEELVWRGLVLDVLTERFGTRRGWIAALVLYAVVMVPTMFTLRSPDAGLNPLMPTAALGAGLVWTFAAARLGRLPPVMISHMVFCYFSVVQFRWPGM